MRWGLGRGAAAPQPGGVGQQAHPHHHTAKLMKVSQMTTRTVQINTPSRAIGAQIRAATLALLLFTLITGLLYPLLITGLALLLFPWQANGSIIEQGGQQRGSALIGQPFSDPRYFWGRLSATAPFAYNAAASGGSNNGPMSDALLKASQDRIQALMQADPTNTLPIPVDLVTASASGLDPHISPAAAEYQIARVARARGMSIDQLRTLVQQHTEAPMFGILGEMRINVLQLNLALDAQK